MKVTIKKTESTQLFVVLMYWFALFKVVPGDVSGTNETVVDVNILTSPTFTIKVPPHLDPKSAEFIEYIAGKALQLYKQNF